MITRATSLPYTLQQQKNAVTSEGTAPAGQIAQSAVLAAKATVPAAPSLVPLAHATSGLHETNMK